MAPAMNMCLPGCVAPPAGGSPRATPSQRSSRPVASLFAQSHGSSSFSFARRQQPFASPSIGTTASRRGGLRRRRGDACTTCSLQDTAVGLGIFFTPSILATIYAFYRGKGNVKDGYSRLLTEVRPVSPCVLMPPTLTLPEGWCGWLSLPQCMPYACRSACMPCKVTLLLA